MDFVKEVSSVHEERGKEFKLHLDEETNSIKLVKVDDGSYATLEINTDDITRVNTSVIVNVQANNLGSREGVARVVKYYGGDSIQRQLNHMVDSFGKFKPGAVVVTGAGKLRNDDIIHVVAPIWEEHKAHACAD